MVYNLRSSAMVNTPGLILYIKHVHATDPINAKMLFEAGFPTLISTNAFSKVCSGEYEVDVENEIVKIEVE